MKVAVCQCSDPGPIESLAVMLRAAGYEPHLPDRRLIQFLRALGLDNVQTVETAMSREGVERPLDLPAASVETVEKCDLFVDIKAQRNAVRLWRRWPRLKNRLLWYRINGGEPAHVVNSKGDHGDEIHPPCPVLTANLWYATPGPWSGKAYACWPPFYRQGYYYPVHGRPDRADAYEAPLCLVHNLAGWGHGLFADPMRALGVKMYGNGSPDGLLQHSELPAKLSRALAYVHLKSNDAPGYALYEALSAACPVLVSKRLLDKCLMRDLFEPGVTCLQFDDAYLPEQLHHGHTEEDVRLASAQIAAHLQRLRDPAENRRIGLAGRERLLRVTWNDARDGDSLRAFMRGHYG